MRPDLDQAWRDFAGWRVNYDATLIGLLAYLRIEPGEWFGDHRAVPTTASSPNLGLGTSASANLSRWADTDACSTIAAGTRGSFVALAIDAGATDVPLIEQTIGDNLDETVARFGDREALVVDHQGIRQTWSEFNDSVNAVAKGLMAYGIEKGDRVGMWSPNYAEWVYIQFATAKIGAIQVNINPSYRTNELEYAMNQSGCRMLVTCTEYLTSAYRDMVEQVQPNCPDLERVVYFDTDDWANLIAAGDEVSDEQLQQRMQSLAPDDAINIQYTSGTTGFPKGATLSHKAILNDAKFVGMMCAYDETDRVAIPVPFYHCFGMVMGNLACAVFGACMVIPCPTLTRRRCCAWSPMNAALRCTAYPPCSSPSLVMPISPSGTCLHCVRASWPAHRVRSRSCGRSSTT